MSSSLYKDNRHGSLPEHYFVKLVFKNINSSWEDLGEIDHGPCWFPLVRV